QLPVPALLRGVPVVRAGVVRPVGDGVAPRTHLLAEGALSMKPHGIAFHQAMYLLAFLPVLGVFGLWAWRQRRLALARLGYAPALRTLISEQGWLRLIRNFCGSMGLSMLVMG